MKQFILFFRMDLTTPEAQPNEAQMAKYMEDWNNWLISIADQGQLSGGNHLSKEGRVLEPNNKETDGPYKKTNDSVAGYILILASDLEDATRIAASCPILKGTGTSVEIRQIAVA